jgi:hypothetical protein
MASESQDGERLDQALVKNITGGEPIAVRFLHKEFFTYHPVFKVWMSSNYKPNIKGQDWGIWRRLKLLPFEVYNRGRVVKKTSIRFWINSESRTKVSAWGFMLSGIRWPLCCSR